MVARMRSPLLRRLGAALLVGMALVLAWSVGVWAGPTWQDLSADALAVYGLGAQDIAAISQGFEDGTWRPGASMTRRQFVRMAVRQFGIPESSPEAPTFADVSGTDPAFAAIEGAVAAELIRGVAPGRFAPDDPITRGQAAAVVARRVAQRQGVNIADLFSETSAREALAGFSDSSAVGPGLVKDIAYAVREGIVRGTGSGRLEAGASLTRIQGAAFLVRAGGGSQETTTTMADGTSTTVTSVPSSTTSTSASTSTTSVTSTTTIPATTTTTAGPGQPRAVYGQVMDSAGQPVGGATVAVRLNAADPSWEPGGDSLAQGLADSGGLYSLEVGSLPLGSIIEVTAGHSGNASVTVYGVYDETREEVSFLQFGADGGDRRLPMGMGGIPPFPFEGLLPE